MHQRGFCAYLGTGVGIRMGFVVVAMSAALAIHSAFADPEPSTSPSPGLDLVVGGDDPVPTPEPEPGTTGPASPSGCGVFDPDCSKKRLRYLTKIHVAPFRAEGGMVVGDNGVGGAIAIEAGLAAFDIANGDLSAIPFEVVYLPERGGLRIRFALAESNVFFFCKDMNGNQHVPPTGLFQGACSPDASVGLGARVVNGQVDTATGRTAFRWLEANIIYNFLKNGNSVDFLRRRLMAYGGASFDTVWTGSTPGAPTDFQAMPRLNLGIMGMFRSKDNRWEIRGLAGYRPNVIAWDNWAVEARSQVMYHLLMGRTMLADIGLDAQYSHWSVPAYSMGTFTSDREQNSGYLGAMFGLTFN